MSLKLHLCMALTGLLSGATGFLGASVNAQTPVTPVPVVGRTLSGGGDLGDLGRFIGSTSLGTITVSSDQLFADENGVTPSARSITINENGFAWTSSGILLRNGSGSDLVFDGNNANSQSHDLEVYYFGTGGGPIDGLGRNVALGDFSVSNFSLSGANQSDQIDQRGIQTFDADGGVIDSVVQTYGGFWEQSATYRNAQGDFVSEIPAVSSNPFTASGEIRRPSLIVAGLNRTDSPAPAAFPTEDRPFFRAPSFLDESESLPLQRSGALFEVEPTVTSDVVDLDLSGIQISVSGQSILDRQISGGVTSLGRFIKDDSQITVSRSDTVTLGTFGSDESRTRLNLAAFTVGDGESEVTASLDSSADFNSNDSTATVNLSGEFTIDRNEIGTFTVGHDVGDNISSPENVLGQNNQSNLTVGYQYGVVDNNTVVSEDITVFKLGEFDTTGESVFGNVELEQAISTHTNLGIDSRVTLDNSLVQTVTLSEGQGITAEGLEGEEVIAETTFQVHTRQIATSQLEANEGDVAENGSITIENTREATGLDAVAFLVGESRNGSARWFFPPDASVDLAAGESVNLTPTFDETGLSEVEDGGLGRNFRTRINLQFQDGLLGLADQAVEGTELSDSQRFSRFDIFGSDATRQEFNFIVERAVEAEAASGSISLASGVSLFDEGINLTNAFDNTSEGFQQSSVEILDGLVSGEEGITVDVAFTSLGDASSVEVGAIGFEDLSSDIAQITGLDGLQHTLQLNFNFTDELPLADASLLWLDEGLSDDESDAAWVNAILGNSDIESYDLENDLVTLLGADEAISLSEFLDSRRFELSYTDYLLSLENGVAELGAFGFDEVTGVVWAVIDHNSSFASTASAVPEPGASIVIVSGLIAYIARRRRS